MYLTNQLARHSRRWTSFLNCVAIALSFNFACGQPTAQTVDSWWRGNIHTHTLWSDGDDFPEMIADWYRSHGYHFLALSDHNILSEGVRWMKHDEIVAVASPEGAQKLAELLAHPVYPTRNGHS